MTDDEPKPLSEFWSAMNDSARASRNSPDWAKAGIRLNPKNFDVEELSEWLRKKVSTDPDVDTEAGMPLPLKSEPGPIMMALVELTRFAPSDPVVKKLTANAMVELDRLCAENRRLFEACKASALVIGLSEDASERYEALAERFYQETGMMAPGKDAPAAMASDDEGRSNNWHHWINAQTISARGLLRAAIEKE